MESRKYKYARKLAFSKFVNSKQQPDDTKWQCCDIIFSSKIGIHKHVARNHIDELKQTAKDIIVKGCSDARWSVIRAGENGENNQNQQQTDPVQDALPVSFLPADMYPWLPMPDVTNGSNAANTQEEILLFYKYRIITNTEHVYHWQKELCRRLCLSGKIRVATEGINGTVGGCKQKTQLYIDAMMHHPLFKHMDRSEFKCSEGDNKTFTDGLKIGIYKEVVPMGIDPEKVTPNEGGEHISPETFHSAVQKSISENNQNVVFVDCRNFYESKIGKFEGAVTPDIRKFSYWPEYVDKNVDFYRDKSVYMYCTGGIRCERGSAYLKLKGVCRDIYQLNGGIHKYIEQYPDGFFRGKMFVFDDRYTIKANEDILSACVYCGEPWDKYKLCSTQHCSQLVLSCTSCDASGRTACCTACHNNSMSDTKKEECDCTKNRPRIPQHIVK